MRDNSLVPPFYGQGWNFIECWCWMGQWVDKMKDTWQRRRPFVVDLLRARLYSLVPQLSWQGHLCLRNCVGNGWNCMEVKDNEVGFPCQRWKNNEHEMD